MKKTILISVLIVTSFLYAQTEGPDIDLIVQTQAADGYQIKFELVPISVEYCWSSYCWNFSIAQPVSNNTVVINGTSNCYWNGWDYRRCFDNLNTDTWPCNETGIPSTIQPLRNGFYRMNIYVNNIFKTYFYYDNRDADLPKGGCWNPSTGCCYTCYYLLRSSVKYNLNENKIYFLNDWTNDLSNPYWFEFPKESILFLRDIKHCNPPNFSPFWNNGLVVVPQKNQTTGIYEPFVVWGPHKEFNPTGYQIYWRMGGIGNFTLLATVGPDIYTYRHEGLAIGNNTIVEYKVRAVRNQTYSEFTNTATISVSGFFKENKFVDEISYSLHQNFPNPFNPSTTIGFTIKETEFVKLKIFDLLGNEIKTLVNEIKTPGLHYVVWDGDNNYGEKISSGIYFYRIQTERFSQSKKLLLQK